MDALLALVTILALLPPNALAGRCIARNRDRIVAAADRAAAEQGVPPAVLLGVAMLESHVGCTTGRGNASWGAPISRARRGVAGGARESASALAWGRRRCGSWVGALAHYRCGLCRPCPRLVGYTDAFAAAFIRRAYARAGAPLPEGFERPARR